MNVENINDKKLNFNTLNIGNITIDKNQNVVYSIKKDQHIYKGTHSFVTVEKEKRFLEKTDPLQPFWFGSDIIGYLYSQRYDGGLNSYKFINFYIILVNIYISSS